MPKHTFSSMHLLEACPWTDLQRCLGIRVGAPYTHNGFTPPRECVDIEREAPGMNTITTVELAVDAGNWKPKAKEMTRTLIADLDKAIAELKQHRNWLKDSLSHITAV